jgi:hypothetical protein
MTFASVLVTVLDVGYFTSRSAALSLQQDNSKYQKEDDCVDKDDQTRWTYKSTVINDWVVKGHATASLTRWILIIIDA